MPSPGDPRLKAYERQKEIDKEALRLFGRGYTWAEAYNMAMDGEYGTGGIVPKDALATIHHDCVLPRAMVAKMEEQCRAMGPARGTGTVNITVNLPVADCDAQAAQRFPAANIGKRQMPLVLSDRTAKNL